MAGPAEVKLDAVMSLPFEQVLRSVIVPEVKILPEELDYSKGSDTWSWPPVKVVGYEGISNICERTNLKTMVRNNTIIFYPVADTNAPTLKK